MSSFSYDQGLIIHVNSRLIAYEPDKTRSFQWTDGYANQIALYYSNDSNKINIKVNVDGYYIYDDSVYIDTEEWNGTDGEWHDLSIELVDNELLGLRDGKIQFEFTDNRLRNVSTTGYLTLSGYSAVLCFDDITIISLVEEPPPPYVCGDTNNDSSVNVSDAVYIINYVFVGGAAPYPIESGDANCDTTVNVSDAVYIINYVFVGGNDPCDSDGDTIPDC